MKTMLLMLVATGLTGCAAMQESYRLYFIANYCSYDGGFEKGHSEGRSGAELSTSDFNMCPKEMQAEAKNGYREGFPQGNRARVNDTLVDSIADRGSLGNHICRASIFGETYNGTGISKESALAAAKAKCEKSSNRIFCDGDHHWECETI